MKKILFIPVLGLLAACAPATEEDYYNEGTLTEFCCCDYDFTKDTTSEESN